MKHVFFCTALVILLTVSFAHASDKEQWSIDSTTGLHAGISAGMGFTANSMMIAAQGRRAGDDKVRPWVAFGVCMVPGLAKEYGMDSYPSYTDLLADIGGCGLGVWSAGKLFVTVDDKMVVLHGRL